MCLKPVVGLAYLLLASLLTTSSAGCATEQTPPDWENRVLDVRRLHDRGRHDEAERRYRRLQQAAQSKRERRYVQLQLARLAADRKEYRVAVERYRKIWTAPTDDPYAPRALTEAARVLQSDLGERRDAQTLWRTLVREFPASTGAEQAIEALGDDYAEANEWDRLIREFEALYADVSSKPIADDILFHLADLLESSAERDAAAIRYYEQIIRDHPDGDMVDDAEWRLGQLHRRHQDWTAAVRVFDSLARRVQTSWFVGSFNSPYASKARFALGLLHLTHLGEYDTAIAHFDRYLRDFPRNRRADDAAWHLAHAHRLAGNEAKYRDALERLVDEFPESRYVPRAKEELDTTTSKRRESRR